MSALYYGGEPLHHIIDTSVDSVVVPAVAGYIAVPISITITATGDGTVELENSLTTTTKLLPALRVLDGGGFSESCVAGLCKTIKGEGVKIALGGSVTKATGWVTYQLITG